MTVLEKERFTLYPLLEEDETIFEYVIEGNYYPNYFVGPKGSSDIAGCIEETLHRMLDAGMEEQVYGVLGLTKEKEDTCETMSIDLGYVIPNMVLGCKEQSFKEIDITKSDVRAEDIEFVCVEGLNDGNEVLSTSYGCWFDVDSYFGTDTNSSDATWVNFFTFWDPKEHNVSAMFVIDSGDSDEEYFFPLTKKEKDFFNEKMEEMAKRLGYEGLEDMYQRDGEC